MTPLIPRQSEPSSESLTDAQFPDDVIYSLPTDTFAYLLLETAHESTLMAALYEHSDAVDRMPLFYRPPFKHLREVTPVLACLDEGLLTWFLAEQVHRHAGIIVLSKLSLHDLAEHLLTAVYAKAVDGTRMIFRLYDPLIMYAALEVADAYAPLVQWFTAFEGILFYGADKNNISMWSMYAPQLERGKDTPQLDPGGFTLCDDLLADMQAVEERRLINEHVLKCKEKYNKSEIVSEIIKCIDTQSFKIMTHRAKRAFLVTDQEYAHACERLCAIERAYEIDNFAYLKECDRLMYTGSRPLRLAFDAILEQKELFIGERIRRCKELQEKH